jgi:hypothetical protein
MSKWKPNSIEAVMTSTPNPDIDFALDQVAKVLYRFCCRYDSSKSSAPDSSRPMRKGIQK